MFAKLGKLSLSLVAGALLLAGCEASDGLLGADDGQARFTVLLTDAPGDLKEAWVKVNKVVLVKSESGDAESGERVELTPKSTDWVNLLSLSGGQVADLISQTVPAGTYEQLRLVVCDMYIRTNDGRVIAAPSSTLPEGVTATAGTELKLTSQCKSGFKVNFAEGGITVDEGNTTVVVDFDVKQSFVHQAGRSGKWIVKPVLHGVKQEKEASIRGTVALQNVTLPVACGGESLSQSGLLAKFVPTATAGTTVRTGSTNGQGEYRISHVAPGSYTLGVDKVGFANGDTLTFTAAATPASVTVAEGATATASYAVTAAACKVKPAS